MQWFDQNFALSQWPRRTWISLTAGLCLSAAAYGQDDEDDKEEKPDKEKPKGPPAPEDLDLKSKDHVLVKATYWEPEEADKETIPIILIHGWEGNREEYDLLGKSLQGLGHAVISVDLRGHGGSTTLHRPDAAEDIEIKPEKLTKQALEAMVYDVQAAKDFLFTKHVAGKLNLNSLCVVGADLGAIVAMNFAAYDWTRPQFPAKIFKNGQDVQGLVLLSPPQSSVKGLTPRTALSNPIVAGRVSTMIIVGADEPAAAAAARKLHGMLAAKHIKVDGQPEAERGKKKDLFVQNLATELQGTKLLVRGLKTDAIIQEFVRLRLEQRADEFPWAEREKPR